MVSNSTTLSEQPSTAVDVVVAAYRGLGATRDCLESVLDARQQSAFEIIVVDDASPEPELSAYLDELAARGAVTLLRNASNLGFVQSVNRAMALHPQRDVVLLNSDTVVANDWLDRLRACAYSGTEIGTVTPFSNNATICSYPVFCADNALPAGFDTAALDRVFKRVNRGKKVAIPTAVGFCMYIKRACLDKIGLFDAERFGKGYGEENDFSLRAEGAGFSNVLCGDTFVYHVGSVSFGAERGVHQESGARQLLQLHPDYDERVRRFVEADPARELRRAVDAAIADLPQPIVRREQAFGSEARREVRRNLVCIHADAAALPLLEATLQAVSRNSVEAPHLLVAVPAHCQAAARAAIGQAELAALDDLAQAAAARLREFDGAGVLLVEAGMSVPFAWDARLAKVARSEPAAASVSPLCDAAPEFALLEQALSEAELARADRLAFLLGPHSYFEVPGFLPGCCYLSRRAVEEIAALEKPARPPLGAWTKHLSARGYLHLCADSVYVGRPGAAPQAGDAKPEAAPEQLARVRTLVSEAFEAGTDFRSMPGLDPRPVQLHVTHDLGGGAIQWVKDFANADAERINLVLKPYSRSHAFGEGLALYSHPDDDRPLLLRRFAHPIQATTATHLEYRRALEQIVRDYCVEAVLVSSLVGHALDILDTGLPTVVIGHDYYPYCPAINLYNGGVCTHCDEARLKDCHDNNRDFNPFLKFPYAERSLVRRRFMELVEARNVTLAVPTRSVRDNLVRLQGKFRNVAFEVIGHGSDPSLAPLQLPAPAPEEKLRVLVLGQLSLGKGSALLLEAIERITGFAEVFLIGAGEVGELFRNMPGVHPVTSYRREDLAATLLNVRPDLGLLLSIVPETFSYTLTELVQFGIPVVATNVGSFRERIEHGVTGYLFEPNADALVATLRAINGDKAKLLELRKNLAPLRMRTEAEMVAEYHRILPLADGGAARYPLHRTPDAPQDAAPGYEASLSQSLMLSEAWKQIKQLNLMLTLKEDVLRRGEWKTNQTERDLQQKEMLLDQKTHALDETGQRLQYKERALEHKDNLLAHRDQQLQHVTQVLLRRDEELRQQDRAIEQRDGQLAKTQALIEQQSRQLAEVGKQLANKDRQLADTQSLLERRAQELQERARQLQESGAQLHEVRLQLTNVAQESAERHREMLHRQQIIQAREAQLAELYASTSWKISRPVRWVGHAIRKTRILARCLWKPVICNPRHAPAILAELYRVWRRSGMLALKLHLVALPDIGKSRQAFGPATQEFALTIRSEIENRIAHLPSRPLISILMPTYNTPEPMLRETIQSVLDQLYPKWELCIADDCSTEPHVKEVLRQYAARDSRIRLHFDKENKGVSHASNQALKMARGEFTVLLDHDDALEPQAIFRVAESVLAEQPDLLYSDEVIVADDGTTVLGYAFRPAFSPELLRAHPYIVHLVGFRTGLLREIGGFDETLKISQDYDLILRAAEQAHTVVHVPEILYRWRTHTQSAGHQKMAQVMEASKAILRRHLQRCGDKGTVQDGPSFNFFDTRYPMEPGARVAIIIPTKNHGKLVKQCIDSIERTVSRVPYEIVLIDHESTDPESVAYFESLKPRVKVLRYAGPFNFSTINNWAIKQLDGWYSHYLLCNNDIEAIKPGWLEHMVELCQRPSVGAVGPMLFYPDGKTIQHAGVCVGAYGAAEHYGKFIKLPDQGLEPGYLGSLIVTREVSCVTAACMLIRREVFEEIEGFDDKLAVGFGDVDLCLKVVTRGHRILFCPGEALIHHESVTRGKSTEDPHPEDSAYFVRKWKKFLTDGDPYFNPNLSLFSTAWHVKVPLVHELALKRRVCKLDRKHERQDVIVANSILG
jgi:GT2 family glycosyltransferase/glycosyltransferase involved in cell wall biosynthesis